jgi:hypothetical protein
MMDLLEPRHLVILFFPFAFLVLLATVITVLVRNSGHASGNSRSLPMRIRESFLDIVPRAARRTATVLLCLAMLIGMIFGFFGGRSQMLVDHAHGHFPAYGPYLPVLISLACLLPGAFVGSLFAIWILGLGYVYADARRRNMPEIPWMLIAAIVPNLLGFLLYFVLRKPIASPCPHCGQPKTPDQLFCPWCGYQAPSPSTAAIPPQTV